MRSRGFCGRLRGTMGGLRGVKDTGGPRNRIPKKLSDAQVDAIRYHYPGVPHTEVGKLFGVTGWLVGKIRRGQKRIGRATDSKDRVIYQPPPVEMIDRIDLDVWFVRRGRALLRGYTRAVEKWEKEGRFEEPRAEEWRVTDEYGADGIAFDARTSAERIVQRAAKLVQSKGPRPAKRPQDQADKGSGKGGLPASDLLFDPKR